MLTWTLIQLQGLGMGYWCVGRLNVQTSWKVGVGTLRLRVAFSSGHPESLQFRIASEH